MGMRSIRRRRMAGRTAHPRAFGARRPGVGADEGTGPVFGRKLDLVSEKLLMNILKRVENPLKK